MKKVLIISIGLMLLACASNVPMKIVQTPDGKTAEQQQLDNLECHNHSQTHGPWLFGLGQMIMESQAATRYQDCMSAKGYRVVRQ